MGEAQKGEGNATLKKVSRYLWIVLAVAVLYTGWTFFSRWWENRAIEQKSQERKQAADQRDAERIGGNRFEILHFYAAPGILRRGETAQLCYGVSNAKAVRVEPKTSEVWPAASRCIEITPARDTTYTLTAEDAAGQTKTATVEVKVR